MLESLPSGSLLLHWGRQEGIVTCDGFRAGRSQHTVLSYGNACLGRLFMMEETGMVSWSIHPAVPPKGEGVSLEMGIPGTRNEAYTGTEEREIAACLEYCW